MGQEALATDRRELGGYAELECEYCFKREKELCSPMVVDFSREEAEEFLKQQEAVRASLGYVSSVRFHASFTINEL